MLENITLYVCHVSFVLVNRVSCRAVFTKLYVVLFPTIPNTEKLFGQSSQWTKAGSANISIY